MVNQVVLVTGASSGIGKATAEFLMKKGFRVYGTSRKAEGRFNEGHAQCDPQSGGFIDMIPLDVTSSTSVEIALKTVVSREGHIDVLVSNAGTGVAGSIEDVSTDEAKAQFETNFFGALRIIQCILPIMRKQGFGKIIALSSVAGVISIPYQGHYSSSKFAIEGLIEALRYEIAPFGLKACIVEPGDTKTGFTNSRVIAGRSDEKSPYYPRFKRSLARMEHDEQNGVSPVVVAKTIHKMIIKKNPPVRTTVGFQYKAILFLKRILPTFVTEKLVGMLYN
jgi:short-subunit dehydrogenase